MFPRCPIEMARCAAWTGAIVGLRVRTHSRKFPEWSALNYDQRAHHMLKVAEVFEKRKLDITEALTGEGGGWVGKGMFETGYVPEIFHAAAASNYAPIDEVIPSDSGKLSMAMRRPMGVFSLNP